MAKQFWKTVNQVIDESDIILEILDSRLPEDTRNKEVEQKVKFKGKTLIYVLNKCDLISIETSKKLKTKYKPSVFVSCKEKHGKTKLREAILSKTKKQVLTVGVVGYPNTGKSSIINLLAGRKAARTSSMSGFTRGIQKIRADNRIMLLDTPGVLPFKEKDEIKHALIGSIDYNKLKEPDIVVEELMELYPGLVEKHYKINFVEEDYLDTVERIAEKLKKFKKGGIPDIKLTSRTIIKDWQTGKIKI